MNPFYTPGPPIDDNALVVGEGQALCVSPDGRVSTGPPPPLLLCGSFNPLHAGHLGMMSAASAYLNHPAAYEISLANVEKATLDVTEVRRRLAQFVGRAPLWLTQAPTYVQKAALFPGTVFLVGADTAARIIEARFYAGDMLAALDTVRQRGCRFLVAGRVDRQGSFVGLADLEVPSAVRDLFDELPGFRLDLSSTALRGG